MLPLISIITPTYNRAYTLDRLYNSLVTQDSEKFEWIIIDDGSTDETRKKCLGYINDSIFKIQYYKQNNSGKPAAINLGVTKAVGDYIFIVDSDDALTLNAIGTIYDCIVKYTVASDFEFSGLGFRKSFFDGKMLGKHIERNTNSPMLLHSTDCNNLFKVDLAYCFKRELMIKYPFPKFKDEKFVPELFIWNKITDVAKIIFFPNVVVYYCEYLADGLTNNFKKQLRHNPIGFAVYYKDQFHREHSTFNIRMQSLAPVIRSDT